MFRFYTVEGLTYTSRRCKLEFPSTAFLNLVTTGLERCQHDRSLHGVVRLHPLEGGLRSIPLEGLFRDETLWKVVVVQPRWRVDIFIIKPTEDVGTISSGVLWLFDPGGDNFFFKHYGLCR